MHAHCFKKLSSIWVSNEKGNSFLNPSHSLQGVMLFRLSFSVYINKCRDIYICILIYTYNYNTGFISFKLCWNLISFPPLNSVSWASFHYNHIILNLIPLYVCKTVYLISSLLIAFFFITLNNAQRNLFNIYPLKWFNLSSLQLLSVFLWRIC